MIHIDPFGKSHSITIREKPNSYAQQPYWWEVGYLIGTTLFSAGNGTLEHMHQWCQDVIGEPSSIFGSWSRTRNTFSFRDHSTFMMFKMRWQGHGPE